MEAAVKPEPLTCAQERGLAALITFINLRGYPPTPEELAHELGYKRGESAGYLLVKLAQSGHIERDPSTARAIRVRLDVEGNPVRFGIIPRAVLA